MKYPIAFEVLVMSRDLAFRKYKDKLKKADEYEREYIDYPTEHEIIEIAAALLDFLDQYCEMYTEEESTYSRPRKVGPMPEPVPPAHEHCPEPMPTEPTPPMVTSDSNNLSL